ncbi:MAG: mannose-1-phosphate guanylyltransferase [Deltaproteobacteria bacterium]
MIGVILAGGKGIRLWPESRRQRPKQLCNLVGDSSMLDQTIDRLKQAGSDHIVIITGDDLLSAIEKLIGRRADKAMIEILSEPRGRNTAPAVGMVLSKYPEGAADEILGIFPADHHILDTDSFAQSINLAQNAAEQNYLVTIGITPQRPETGFGYIERSQYEFATLPDVYSVDSFLEKPDLPTAESYLLTGQHMWNSGIYIGKREVWLKEFEKHLPEVYQHIAQGYEHYLSAYDQLPDISLDYGIAEKSTLMAVVPSDFGWSDLGSWNALADIHPADGSDNVFSGPDVLAFDSKNCLVKQVEKTVVLFGVNDLLLVETDDLILVAPRQKVQDIRTIVHSLEEMQRHDLL